MNTTPHPFHRCDHWQPERCSKDGEVWLICPDGRYCPGGPVCLPHAQACINEYREKLGEMWTYTPTPASEQTKEARVS